MKTVRATIATALFVCVALPSSAAPLTTTSLAKGSDRESADRNVDGVALQAQLQAISRLRQLVTRYRKTSQEPVLLMRAAEAYQQESAIRFRIAHGRAQRNGRTVDLAAYKKALREAIAVLDQVIKAYPAIEEIDAAYAMRAKSWDDLDDKVKARADYEFLTRNHPESEYASTGFMALAEYAIEANHHAEALEHLAAVERKPQDPQFPFALFKMAWSHYNLHHVPESLSYLERHVAFYNQRIKERALSSDLSLRDNSLSDLALFYMEGTEKHPDDYPSRSAYSYFRKIESGDGLGKMLVRYAKLLRARGLEDELSNWKDKVLSEEPRRAETLDVILVAFEDAMNRHRYAKLGALTLDLAKIVSRDRAVSSTWPSFGSSRKVVLDAADKLRELILKNRKATELQEITKSLEDLSLAYAKLAEPNDAKVAGLRYNLAETLFEVGEFDAATVHYRWIVQNWNPKAPDFDVSAAGLRAIASRYEVLKSKNRVPKDLEPKALSASNDRDAEATLKEWISWIDVQPEGVKSEDRDALENFRFEANRILYGASHLRQAVTRMHAFVEAHPKSKFAIPSAGLILDSHVKGNDWVQAHATAKWIGLKIKETTPEFRKKVASIETDSFFKLVEASAAKGDLVATLAQVEICAKDYREGARYPDCLLLGAQASFKSGNESGGEAYLARLTKDRPDSEAAVLAFLERARLQERRYDLKAALQNYEAYLNSPKRKATDAKAKETEAGVWRRVLLLGWLEGDVNSVQARLAKSPAACEAAVDECQRLRAWIAWKRSEAVTRKDQEGLQNNAVQNALKGDKTGRAFWAILGLRQARKLGFRDKNLMFKAIATGWDSLDAPMQLVAFDGVTEIVRSGFRENRELLARYSPVAGGQKSIERRLDNLRDFEDAATKLATKLPFLGVQSVVIGELATAYGELALDLKSLTPPEGLPASEQRSFVKMVADLSRPFDKKAGELGKQAAMMKASIEAGQDLPEFKRELVLRGGGPLEAAWVSAYESKNWPKAAFLTGEAQRLKLDAGRGAFLSSLTLASVGAHEEARIQAAQYRKILQAAATPQAPVVNRKLASGDIR